MSKYSILTSSQHVIVFYRNTELNVGLWFWDQNKPKHHVNEPISEHPTMLSPENVANSSIWLTADLK